MIGYLFETTCLENNKKFIGKRLSVRFDANYFGDNDAMQADMGKYGLGKFRCRMILPYDTVKELDAAEKVYIESHPGSEYYNNAGAKKTRKKQDEEEV